jgi:hypothetical protein
MCGCASIPPMTIVVFVNQRSESGAGTGSFGAISFYYRTSHSYQYSPGAPPAKDRHTSRNSHRGCVHALHNRGLARTTALNNVRLTACCVTWPCHATMRGRRRRTDPLQRRSVYNPLGSFVPLIAEVPPANSFSERQGEGMFASPRPTSRHRFNARGMSLRHLHRMSGA